MFEALRDAFRQAVENFRNELERDDPAGGFARIRHLLDRELLMAARRLRSLEVELEKVRDEAHAEAGEAAVCLRREELARRIGDTETADVAHEYAGRHLRRREILEEKERVLAAELKDRSEELTNMRAQVRELVPRPDDPPGVAGAEDLG
jgi:hypothetical protein